MAADSCVVDIGVFLSVLFVAVSAVLDEGLDTIVSPVMDSESHQPVAVAIKLLFKHIETVRAKIATVEEAQHVVVVLHHGVVNRQELPHILRSHHFCAIPQ